ncbi:bifunctional glycosyltransferase family 2/GtrA family protein [Gallaecimonas xiamenensis]|uniref:Glycosyltransferase n=1 Tax=Gallaecimonas xiamenensis 3-C-1 TaxID=745411 RepID=K2J2G3_9GAMM|nr:bifunctional glycosyltransferase family 2/GtrA family protein [Gallaecimonas xiamenensis]EKE77146.1 glycosyltransferase [Gallaecimonas xiamenensis 3-C-1]
MTAVQPGKPVILIPAYQPDQTLYQLVLTLRGRGPRYPVLVVNDGSNPNLKPLFDALAEIRGVTVLHHSRNQGKGAALKTGMAWVEEHLAEACPGIVTADADGQHLPKDILALAQRLEAYPNKLWLGVRAFEEGTVPLRSRFGNKLTLKVFALATGQQLTDTQTGLRAIPYRYLAALTALPAKGYEFELDMLLGAKDQGLAIGELAITTVYEPGNPSSHFRPLWDSLRIYSRFLRFAGVGLASAGLDYLLFSALYLVSGEILLALILARLFSALFNFGANRFWVFQSRGSLAREAGRYGALALALVALSYALTKGLYGLGLSPFLGKPLADAVILAVSFLAQRYLVFGREKEA